MATQFSATPPARQRFSAPVISWTCRAMRSMISSVTACIDAARSISRCVSGDSGLRGGPPKSRWNFADGHRQPLAVVEVRHVHAERAVVLQVDQVLEDQVGVLRLAVGGQAHELVFAGVDLEAGVVGEGRVEQAERVREPELVRQLDPVAPADAEAGGRPLADAVEREDRRLLERRREERAGGVRLVVLGEDEALGVLAARAPAVISRGRKSFCCSQSGIAWRNDAEARAARRRGRSPAAARTSAAACRRSRRSRVGRA